MVNNKIKEASFLVTAGAIGLHSFMAFYDDDSRLSFSCLSACVFNFMLHYDVRLLSRLAPIPELNKLED